MKRLRKTLRHCRSIRLQEELPSFQLMEDKEHQKTNKTRISGESLGKKQKIISEGEAHQLAWSVSELKDWAPPGRDPYLQELGTGNSPYLKLFMLVLGNT